MMRQNLYFSLLPWLILLVLEAVSPQLLFLSLYIAFASLILLNFNELQRGFFLTWCSFFLFGLMILNFQYFQLTFVAKHAWSLLNGGLALLMWLSLLCFRPFTLQYAKEELPTQFWKNPDFMKMNVYLSLNWALAVTVLWIGSFFLPLGWMSIVILIPLILTRRLPSLIIGHHFWDTVKALSPIDSPFLENNFAPTPDERTGMDLQVEGLIPLELNGMYMRNGPNPQFPPYTYTYPQDGDGMIHVIYLEHGWVQYRNRFIQTEDFLLEKKAGKALFGGVALPISPDPKYVGYAKLGHIIKNGAVCKVIPWQNGWLAWSPGQTAYQLDDNLKTLGEWQPKKKKEAFPLNTHFKQDPNSKETFFSHFDPYVKPYFWLHQFDEMGEYRQKIALDQAPHTESLDFLLTKHFIVILGVKIALIARDTLLVTWIEGSLSECKTPINAFELGDHLKFHYLNTKGELHEGTIDLNTFHFHEEGLYKGRIDFPFYRMDRTMESYRYVYFLEKMRTKAVGVFDCLVKFDLLTREETYFNLPKHWELSEPVFVPDESQTAEDAGYLLFFAYDRVVKKSGFIILDASHPEAKPIAMIKLPARVPHGLHGAWRKNGRPSLS